MTGCSAIVLAGGRGTRVQHLRPGTPKPFIPVAGRPFLEWVLRYLGEQGVSRCVVSLGHLADVALAVLQRRGPGGPAVTTVVEPEALGTGGALLFALHRADVRGPVVVANGDSLVLTDLGPAWRLLDDPAVDGVLVAVRVADAARFGTLDVDEGGRLRGFREKRPGTGWVNAGLYLFRRALLEPFAPGRPLSLERDLLPAWLGAGARLAVHACDAPFLDIGTPESLARAEAFVADHLAVLGAAR